MQSAASLGTGNPPFRPERVEEQVLDRFKNPKIEHVFLHAITADPSYASKSFEELHMEDYTKGNRGTTTGGFSFTSTNQQSPFVFAPRPSAVSTPPVANDSIHDGISCAKCNICPITGMQKAQKVESPAFVFS